MIWVVIFFIFFFVSLKEFFFFSSILCFDSFSIFMSSIVPLVSLMLLMFFFSKGSLSSLKYYNLIFIFCISMVWGTFLVSDSMLFLIFLEMTIMPMSFIILKFSKDYDKISASMFMVSINILGSVPFMVFTSLMSSKMINYSHSGIGFSILLFSELIIVLCFSLVLLCKLPIFLTHFWLTKAHVSASGSSSMILASIMLKLGSYGLYKFCPFFVKIFNKIYPLSMGLSIWGLLIINLIMIRFFDVKYLVACSSIIHMALIWPSLSTGSSSSVAPSILMMVGHGLISYYMFLLVSAMYEKSFNRSFEMNKCLESFSSTINMVLFLFIFINLGFPPLISFISEMLFCSFMLKYSLFTCFIFSISMILSILFCMFFCTKMLFGKKSSLFQLDLDYGVLYNSFFFILFIFLSILIL